MTNPAPERIAVACPHCGKRLQVPVALVGKIGKCPGCQANFTIATAESTTSRQLVVSTWEETPFTPGPSPIYPNQERIGPTVIEPSHLMAKIMAVVCSIFFLGAIFVVPMIVGNGKTSGAIALAIAFFGAGGLFTAFFSSWLIYAGVSAFLSRRIPLSRTSQLRGVPAQIGAVFYILCGVVFGVGMGICIFLMIRENLQPK